MREDAFQIIQKTIADCLPDKAVRDSLQKLDFTGKVYVVAIGKAAWVMFFWLTGWKRELL